jgi:AcrR family transcriptional regulator
MAESPSARAPRGPRPRRGDPQQTRRRLLAAGAQAFRESGYAGTDSNKIARAAGYAPGTFYKHFESKKAIFLAVYEEWVSQEWRAVGAALSEPGTALQRAQRIASLVLAHHRQWHGFRASLRALVAVDDEVKRFYRAQRKRQLTMLKDLLPPNSARPSAREEHALLLFTLERAADALADGEAAALGLRPTNLQALLVQLIAAQLRRNRPGEAIFERNR